MVEEFINISVAQVLRAEESNDEANAEMVHAQRLRLIHRFVCWWSIELDQLVNRFHEYFVPWSFPEEKSWSPDFVPKDEATESLRAKDVILFKGSESAALSVIRLLRSQLRRGYLI